MSLVTLLRRMPLFEGLAREEMEALAALLRRRSVRKGDVIFRKGDEGTNLYVILRGSVRITVPTALGDEIAVAVMKDGEFFGDMALLDGMPRSASASAGEETQLAILERGDFLNSWPNAIMRYRRSSWPFPGACARPMTSSPKYVFPISRSVWQSGS